MKPLVFEFKETPERIESDYSLIEYSSELNLSVNKVTGKPAIDVLNLDTETFSKSKGEATDSDNNGISMLMDTATRTYTEQETSDDDPGRISMLSLIDTSTLPEGVQPADEDKDWNDSNNYSQD